MTSLAIRPLIRIVLAATIVLTFGDVRAAYAVQLQDGRQADIDELVGAVKSIHPDPFRNVDPRAWNSAAEALKTGVDSLSPNQFAVSLQRLVAMLGDAHTSINPESDPVLSTTRYPLELYLFEDGLHVRSAAPEYAALVGGRVVRIGNVDPGRAISSVATTISHENTWWIRATAPKRLVIPEVLDGLGILDDPARLPISVDKGGVRYDTVVTPVSIHQVERHGHGTALDKSGWPDMRQSATPPLWQQRPGDPMWHTWLEESATMYVCYRSVSSSHEGQSNAEFWDAVFAEVDRRNPDRFVIDIRENRGGNRMLNRRLIQQIMRRPDLDRDDRLFVIIGRETFSAAQQLASQLDWWTQTTFVGEPTGQSVSQYGDVTKVVLPNSGISVFISTRFHQAPNPIDRRDFIPPDIYAPLMADDYRRGVDPALGAVLSSGDRQPVMSRVIGALQAGQLDTAKRLLVNANMDPANRYRNFESEINALGYDLLSRGQIDAAVVVFEINTQVYPASPNTYDSLGEALVQAGRRAEAIESYRKALEIDPTFLPSLEALDRLENGRGE